MKVLITGGAGYIGSITNRVLMRRGIDTVVLDNLWTGHASSVPAGCPLIIEDIREHSKIKQAFEDHKFDAVMHFAGLSEVGQSVQSPLSYYDVNVNGTIRLLSAMKESGLRRLIFSSTAAIYGEPLEIPISEDHPIQPLNPYGSTKAAVEAMLDYCSKAWGLEFVSLRYFNAAGAALEYGLGEDHGIETHLIPLVLKAALEHSMGRTAQVDIFGTDYDTPDGTCIRDYIHVLDLAEAHVLALDWLDSEKGCGRFNLGNGKGFSVKEVIETCREVTGIPVPAVETARREGDPSVLVASAERSRTALKWIPEYPGLHEIVRTAWNWMRNRSEG